MKWFSKKYRFFKQKIKDVTASIWEQEFKIAKSRQIREGVRQDRDRAKEAINQMDAAINAAPDEATKAKTEAQKAVMQDNVKRYEAQMKMIDEQINGVPASEGNPGQEGIIDRIKGYTELREMYKQYLKEN